eukprot:scaffold65817_cov68-Attheya_sp.AAC.2
MKRKDNDNMTMMNDEGSDRIMSGGSPVLEISQDDENDENDEDDEDGWVHPDERDKPSFIERRAMGMANRPCLHLLTALVVAIALSVFGLIVGDFSIAAENAGWESRGTRIADRQAQVILVGSNRDELFRDDPAIWDDLQNNIQKRFDEDRRRLTEEPLTTTSNLIASRARDIHTGLQRGNLNGKRERSFHLNQEGNSRNLQALDECETEWYVFVYGSDSMLYDLNLWPVWKTVSDKTSALTPDVMLEICEAETSTQAELERQGLCMGCPDGKCLPPYSLILMVRTMLDSFDSSCAELMQAYAPEQDFFTSTLQTCVEDIKTSADISSVTSCPEGFYPSFVDDKFGADNPVLQYTSSYYYTADGDDYYTGDGNIDAIYDIVNTFDRSNGGLVSGVYETTNEYFVNKYIDSVLLSDMVRSIQISLYAQMFSTLYSLISHIAFVPFLIQDPRNGIRIRDCFCNGSANTITLVELYGSSSDHPIVSTFLLCL